MSDSEDDYMSDKVLMACEKQDVRPGLLFNQTQKREHELLKQKDEFKRKKPKSYREQEQEARDKGLGTAISSDNKGFKLLEKMGYKSGTGLGKSFTGITEPVGIKTKNNTSGVGREEHLKNVQQKKVAYTKESLVAIQQDFRSLHTERHLLMTLQRDYRRAQRACEDLDFKNNVESPQLPYFWTKRTRDMLKKKNAPKDEESSNETEDDQEEEQIEEINDSTLGTLIVYLREEYRYCIYCGDFVDQDDEDVSCPGYLRKDHDD